MRFALISDRIAINSYYIKNNISYDYTHKPYIYHHAYSSECYIAMQNLPFIFEEGYFWNWSEFETLPDVELDLIFVSLERNFNPDGSIRSSKMCVDTLRKQYPKAVILGWIKEVCIAPIPPNNDFSKYNYNDPRHKRRIEFLLQCRQIDRCNVRSCV